MRTTAQNTELERLVGRNLFSQDGEKIGKVREVYLDEQTGRAEWVTVRTGWFADRVSFVPLNQITVKGNAAYTPLDKEMVREAPTACDASLAPAEEQRLYSHYGFAEAEPCDVHDCRRGERLRRV